MAESFGSVLVVGGGVAGMRASLDLANGGLTVHLVDHDPAVGGKSAQLDCLLCKVCHRYFPESGEYVKMPCGICDLPGLIREVGNHPGIVVHTRSHVNKVEGKFGKFMVSIATIPSADGKDDDPTKPAWTDRDHPSCKCGKDRSPAGDGPDGAGEGKAVEEYRHMLGEGEQKDTVITIGAVILAPGFEEFDPRLRSEYGHGRFGNVVTSNEYERMLSPMSPFGGVPHRPSDGMRPKRIAWLNCVGSRDPALGRGYCSSVCCSFSLKEAVLSRERLPGVESAIFFMDMRTFSKGMDAYRMKAESEHGVRMVRWRVSRVEEDPDTGNLLIKYEDEAGGLREEEFDMVVLSTGFEPGAGARRLAEKLGVELDEFGFVSTSGFNPCKTSQTGVLVCGTFSGPRDIPDTMAEASCAAAEVLAALASSGSPAGTDGPGSPDMGEAPEPVGPGRAAVEETVVGEAPRIGVFFDGAGVDSEVELDLPELAKYASGLHDVAHTGIGTFSGPEASGHIIAEKINELGLNRLVIASGSPIWYERHFIQLVRAEGMDPRLMEMVNLGGHISLVHREHPEWAENKLKDLLRMAVAKSRHHEIFPASSSPVAGGALVIGGGLAGMAAALSVADQGYGVSLVEKEETLGGNARRIHRTHEGVDVQAHLGDLVRKVESHDNITIHRSSRVESVNGGAGNFTTVIDRGTAKEAVDHGVVIVATGAEESRPEEYLFGEDERVMTQLDLEGRLAEGEDFGGKTAVMVQCVGSRDEARPYCSRVCCTDALKNAVRIREEFPDSRVFVLYRDVMTYGFREKLYERAREAGVLFVRYDLDGKPRVERDRGKLRVRVRDPVLDDELSIDADLVALAPAIVPAGSNGALAGLLNVPLDENGFFQEEHSRLRPVDLLPEGVFVCGMAHSPRSLEESTAQAKAAAGRAAAILARDELEAGVNIARLKVRNCAGCKLCVNACPFGAIDFDEEERKAVVREALCQGCGVCSAVCPAGIPRQSAFTKRQMLSVIDACFTGAVR